MEGSKQCQLATLSLETSQSMYPLPTGDCCSSGGGSDVRVHEMEIASANMRPDEGREPEDAAAGGKVALK